MEKVQIKNVRKPFGIVSDGVLTDQRLSVTARLVGAWIEGRSDDFVILPWYLMKVLGITKAAWQKARRELMDNGYLTAVELRVNGRFQGVGYDFQVSAEAGFTGAGKSRPGKTGPGKAGHIPIGVKPAGVKPKKQQPHGGGCEFEVVRKQGQPVPQGQLSDILGIKGPQGQQLDQLAHGASAEQLEMLKAAHADGMAGGKIKNEGAWLAMMAKKAAAGGISEVANASTPPGAGPGGGSVIDELKAVSVPAGTVIMVGEKPLLVEHADGVPRVLADGAWIGPQRSLKVLQRVHAGELSIVSGSAEVQHDHD